MTRLSSNLTLILKIFIPSFWIVFFTLFLLAILLSNGETFPLFQMPAYRYGFVLFYLFFLSFIYFTFMQLKRVDNDVEYVYISNYFKTYRYLLDDVEKIDVTDNIIFKLGVIHLKQKGIFGSKIYFLAKPSNINDFVLRINQKNQ